MTRTENNISSANTSSGSILASSNSQGTNTDPMSSSGIQLGSIAALIGAEIAFMDACLKNAENQIKLSGTANTTALLCAKAGADATKTALEDDAKNQYMEAGVSFTDAVSTGAGFIAGSRAANGELEGTEDLAKENTKLEEMKTSLNDPTRTAVSIDAPEQDTDELAIAENLRTRIKNGHIDSITDDEARVINKEDNEDLKKEVIEHLNKRIKDNSRSITQKQEAYNTRRTTVQGLVTSGGKLIDGSFRIAQGVNTTDKAKEEAISTMSQALQQSENTNSSQADQARSDAMQQYLKALDMLTTLDRANQFRG